MIGIAVVDISVKHDARVRDLDALALSRGHGEVLGERFGEDAPDTIRV